MVKRSPLQILRQGRESWNAWRTDNSGTIPSLRGADLPDRDLSGYDLAEVDLTSANLEGAKLAGATLSSANLGLANFVLADLNCANLQRASLFMARFFGSKLKDADFSHSTLVSTSIINSDLSGANFEKSVITGCIFGNLDLSRAKGLSQAVYWGPSTVGIDTLHRSQGHIPVNFLRGVGIPDAVADYLMSLTQRASLFSSCFISYSSTDERFASMLCSDLQDNGVRCWFAPRDLKVGSSLRSSIDEAIHLHDRLVIILSRNSISSTWVEKEVETAFEKERSIRLPVLFPLRLDDEVFETKAAWAADLRRARHIADFSQWRDRASYKLAFQKLLRDLQHEAGGIAPNTGEIGATRTGNQESR